MGEETGGGGISVSERQESPFLHCKVRPVTRDRSTGCHRTTRANIRFRLTGGPQGWNPHGWFGPEPSRPTGINPSDLRGEGPRPTAARGSIPDPIVVRPGVFTPKRAVALNPVEPCRREGERVSASEHTRSVRAGCVRRISLDGRGT
jgi:hypothetical protein